MTKEVEKWWDEASNEFQEQYRLPTDDAQYGPYGSTEGKLKLLGDVTNKHILEIGCGGAQCSVAFAKRGAICTGIDISTVQLEYAKKLIAKEKVNVNLIKSDIQTLDGIKDEEYDIVFSAMALQYIPDLTTCFKEVYRVLKQNGIFVFSLDHSFYHLLSDKTFKIEKSYHRLGRVEEKDVWPDGSEHLFVIYRRKVSDIVNSIIDAELTLIRMLEPFDPDDVDRVPQEHFPKALAELISPTIIFKTRK
jgi:cyclopropane fatty-acyl-phospholipid synthase-like methyltransferase